MTSLYIHVPFCKKKCNYCDFVSYAGKEELIEAYVDALVKEISALTPMPFETIYFGGGTPTLLEPRHFDKIISTIICHLSLDIGHSEISVESNPGTADQAKLKALRGLGINRLSIGAQSFNDRHLETLGRIHTSKDTVNFYRGARTAGFENINLDLIFALPNQSFGNWRQDLKTAISLDPEHLSTYNLQLEEGTPLWQMLRKPATERRGFQNACREETAKFIRGFPSTLQLPNDKEELKMYEYTIEVLQANGFAHYEISNFAKFGFECQHNINYWKNGNYVGIGAGAHSHLNGKRWANPNSIEEYLTSHEQRFTINDLPDAADQRETLFLGLRLLQGLPTENFIGFEKEVIELIKDGLLMRDNNHYKLTRRGLYLGNLVFEKFV